VQQLFKTLLIQQITARDWHQTGLYAAKERADKFRAILQGDQDPITGLQGVRHE